jgi:hypothetical protein
VIHEELVQTYETSKKLKSFQSALHDTLSELLTQTIKKEMKRLVQDYRDKQKGVERFGWDRWRFVVHLRKVERERRVRGTVGVFLNLQGLMRGSVGLGGTPVRKSGRESEQLRMSYSKISVSRFFGSDENLF